MLHNQISFIRRNHCLWVYWSNVIYHACSYAVIYYICPAITETKTSTFHERCASFLSPASVKAVHTGFNFSCYSEKLVIHSTAACLHFRSLVLQISRTFEFYWNIIHLLLHNSGSEEHTYTTPWTWDLIHRLNEKVWGGESREQAKGKKGSLPSHELLLLHRGLQRRTTCLPSVSTAIASHRVRLGNSPGLLSHVIQERQASTQVENPSPAGP